MCVSQRVLVVKQAFYCSQTVILKTESSDRKSKMLSETFLKSSDCQTSILLFLSN